MRRAAKEIEEEFALRLHSETNTLIDISSGDRAMKRLAAGINRQLRSLRRQRHRFQRGDLELKDAVTNISHDLRTPLTAIYGYLELLQREEKSEAAARYTADRTALNSQCHFICHAFFSCYRRYPFRNTNTEVNNNVFL